MAASVDQSSQILTTAVRDPLLLVLEQVGDPLLLVLEHENKVNVPKRATNNWYIFGGALDQVKI